MSTFRYGNLEQKTSTGLHLMLVSIVRVLIGDIRRASASSRKHDPAWSRNKLPHYSGLGLLLQGRKPHGPVHHHS